MLGYPEQALAQLEANGVHALKRGHPFDIGHALMVGSLVHELRFEPAQLMARAEAAEALGRTHNLPFVAELLTAMMRAVALLRAGRTAEGIATLQTAMTPYHAHGGDLCRPYFGAMLAEGVAALGDEAHALDYLDDSLQRMLAPGRNERSHLAEVQRIRGDILARRGDLTGAEASFLAALDCARGQQAKAWELRAATSLARLWQQQGRLDEAYGLLAPLYAWFTEGQDTHDLRDARALIDTLAPRRTAS
jgi:predicted ATPase